MVWFNTFTESWYQTNRDYIYNQVKKSVNINLKLMSGLPEWIVSLELVKFGFPEGTTPAITRIRTDQDYVRCLGVENEVVKLRRVTFDLSILLHSKRSIADLAIKLPLGVNAMLSLNSVAIMSEARLEVLMSTDQGFPGLVSATFSFTEKPSLSFNVDMYDLIGLDTFGIEKWANQVVRDIISQQLVYPGMIYFDLTGLSEGQDVKSEIVNAGFKEWPIAYSVSVVINPVYVTEYREFEVLVGSEAVPESELNLIRVKEGGEARFDLVLESLANQYVDIRVKKDIRLAIDPVIVEKKVDLIGLLYQNSMNRSYSFAHYENENQWKIDVTLWAYLLPAALIKQNGAEVAHFPTFFSEASCNTDCPQSGVVYVQIHRAAGVLHTDHTANVDPLVRVFLNEKQVHVSKVYASESGNALFDEKFQLILHSEELANQTLRFDVYDHDKITNDDFIGQTSIKPSSDAIINQELYLVQGASKVGHGSIYVSVIFKPVPFYK